MENDRYMLINIGWFNEQRIHYCVIHIDIIDGQVWIQANNTDRLIAEELQREFLPNQLFWGFNRLMLDLILLMECLLGSSSENL
ncbi:element excision factor XisI family protein [Microcoleus sp. D2_18a_D3]|uniref:element excision factor XisI family protein n=1 Tax=Microcoleus sp. D2_18a_D3 TaxID=3055330 RepID=UPI002FCF02DF